MPTQYTTIRELSEILQMDRSATLRYVKRLGYVPEKRRTASSGFQTASVLTKPDANAVIAKRKEEGYL